MRLSLTEVVVSCEAAEVARHHRSWVPADVVLAPDHAHQFRLARQAAARLAAGDPAVAVADLAATTSWRRWHRDQQPGQ